MAKQRVQVAKLNAPTQANLQGGTAPVVETMRVLAPDQTPESPLSSFISAIAPAFEADAADRRIKRLKREQEIQNGIRAKKENQLEQARVSIIGDIALEHAMNEEANLDMGEAAYLEKRQKSYAPYLDKLRSTDLDPELIDGLEGDLQLADVAFMKTKFAPAKVQRNYDQLDEGFRNTLLTINQQVQNKTLTLEDGVEQIAAVRQSFLEAHPERYDDRKINDVMVGLADTDTNDPSRVNSPLVAYLAGPDSKNQLNVERHREVGAKIAKRQAVVQKETNTQAKKTAMGMYTDNVAAQMMDGNFTNINTTTKTTANVDVNGIVVTIDKKFANSDYQTSLEKIASQQMAEVDALPAGTVEEINTKETRRVALQRRTYEAYEAIDSKPPEVALALRYANTVWQGEMTPDNLVVAKAAYEQLEKVEAYLGPEKVASMFGSDKKSLGMYRTLKSSLQGNETFSQAMDVARRFDPATAPKVSVTYKEIQDTIDPTGPLGWIELTNKDELLNGKEMEASVSERAGIIMGTNPYISEEDAKTQAIKEIAADWQAMTMPDGSIVGVKAESGAHVERNTRAVEQVLRDAMKNDDFVNAVSEMFQFDKKLNTGGRTLAEVAASAFSPKVAGFSLMARNDPYNPNILQIYATGTDSFGKMSSSEPSHSLGFIDLTKVTKQQKFKFIEDTLGRHALTVAPIVESTPEDDIELNYTPTVTKSFSEMDLSDIKDTDTFKSLGKAFSTENFYLQKALELNETAVKGIVDVGKKVLDTLNPISTGNATTTLIKDEGFSSTVYIDTEGHETTGHGLKLVDIEPDERALIKDINNVTEDESKAVVELKVNKISNYFSDAVEGFENLPDTARSGMIQMGYQLGRFNVTKEWPKFMESIKEAAQYAEGSIEQTTALAKAKFNMLYNVAEDGKVTATKWATQTKNRAMKVANELASSAGDTATAISEAGAGIVKTVTESIIPNAEASTITPAKVGEQPKGEDVVAMATSPDLVTAALKYHGIDENTRTGAEAIEKFFNDVVGGKAFKGTPEEVAKANAWCAVFLAQILADAGVDANKLMGATDKYAATRSKNYLKIGKPVKLADVKAGDIMVKVHSKADKDAYFKAEGEKLTAFGHVGIVVKSENGELHFIGGNTGDKVAIKSYGHDKDLRIRRLDGVTPADVDNLPSIREMKWGIAGTAVDKLETAWTSMLDIFE